MDACFEIMLPFNVNLAELKFEIPIFGGDEELLLKKEGRRKFGQNFDLRVFDNSRVLRHRNKFLPMKFQNYEWICIGEVNPGGFDKFYYAGKELGDLNDPNSPISMLYFILSGVDEWVVVLSHQCDSFNYIAEGNIEDVTKGIYNYYQRSNEGFLIYHKLF